MDYYSCLTCVPSLKMQALFSDKQETASGIYPASGITPSYLNSSENFEIYGISILECWQLCYSVIIPSQMCFQNFKHLRLNQKKMLQALHKFNYVSMKVAMERSMASVKYNCIPWSKLFKLILIPKTHKVFPKTGYIIWCCSHCETCL